MNNFLLLLTNLFELYVLHRYMNIFFGKCKTRREVTVLVYFLYFFIGSVGMFINSYPIINGIITIGLILMVTQCYSGSRTKKLCVAVIFFIFIFLAEAVLAFAIGMEGNEIFYRIESIDFVCAAIVKIILWLITVILGVLLKKNKKHTMVSGVFLGITLIILLLSVSIGSVAVYYSGTSHIITIGIFAFIIFMDFMMIYLYDLISKNIDVKISKEYMEREMFYYHSQAELMQKNSEELRRFRHDVKNKFYTIKSLIDKNEIEEAEDYISKIEEKLAGTETYSNTGNAILDSIVNYKLNIAAECGAKIKTDILMPPYISIEDDDIVIIVGNLLDNAIEAVSKLDENRFIEMKIRCEKNCLYFIVKNSHNNPIIKENGEFITSKTDRQRHGIGLQSVRAAADKYDGVMDVRHEGKIFEISVMLYCVNS